MPPATSILPRRLFHLAWVAVRTALKSKAGISACQLALALALLTNDMPSLAMTTLLAVVLNDTKMPSGPAAPVPSTCAVNGWSNTRSKCTT